MEEGSREGTLPVVPTEKAPAVPSREALEDDRMLAAAGTEEVKEAQAQRLEDAEGDEQHRARTRRGWRELGLHCGRGIAAAATAAVMAGIVAIAYKLLAPLMDVHLLINILVAVIAVLVTKMWGNGKK